MVEKLQKKLKIGKKGEKVRNLEQTANEPKEEEEMNVEGGDKKIAKEVNEIELVKISDSENNEEPREENIIASHLRHTLNNTIARDWGLKWV